ncbi:MAG: RAMP superfamily CRISPR-associated protein, partial [Candidatus Cloacimonadales bacterium]|nr:RAMP superfamily CRISPR-associated protein [Candidatus Cloacimonadales bacterium]
MNKGKIILKAKLELISPLQIGSGSADISDRDIIVNADGRPYIPASSFIGKLNAVVDDYSFSKYLGIGQDHQSRLQLDDL